MNEKFDHTGRLFKNDRKREGKKDADYKGDLQMHGKEYWLDAWINEGDRGKWMKLSVRPKDAKPAAQGESPAADPTDDVPF